MLESNYFNHCFSMRGKKKQSVPGEQNKNWKVIMYYFPSKERGSYEVRMIIKKELKKKITRH
jgi:hypothetical protein